MSVNKVIIKGRLGQEPENNNGVIRFSVATSEKWNDKDGNKQEKTQWHTIVAFSKLGEIIEKFFHKGDEIFIIGKLEYYQKDDKFYTSIIASEFDFVGNSNNQQSTQPQSAVDKYMDNKQSLNTDDDSDNLPF